MKLLKIEPCRTIERAERQLSKSWINVLVLSVTYESLWIPLFWTVLDEKGCSETGERQAILEKFIAEFGVEGIRFVTADREFCSKQWLAYLIEKQISYRLRIKASYQKDEWAGRIRQSLKTLSDLADKSAIGVKRSAFIRSLWNKADYVAVCKTEDGDNVLVISSERSGKILLEYGQRWQIETLLGVLKTRGFRLEDTHLTEPQRVSKLLSLFNNRGQLGNTGGRI